MGRSLNMEGLKQKLRPYISKIKLWSLKKAVMEQELNLYRNNISDQYTNLQIDNELLEYKLRALHAFQIQLISNTLDNFSKTEQINLYDIGDSCGNHVLMLKNRYTNLCTVSFNCDPYAVDKIKNKGLDAKLIRPDNRIGKWVESGWLSKADVIICLQTMEHMGNLVDFISRLKDITDTFIFTVPFVRKSRLGF
jgi:hypothetical protein